MNYSKFLDWKIIGAQATWNGNAPFMRAKPIVQNSLGEVYGMVSSTDLAPLAAEFTGEDICRFDPVPMRPQAEVWLFRNTFPFREDALREAEESKILLHGPMTREVEDVVGVVVRMNSDAEQVLNDWCDRAAEEAIENAARGYIESRNQTAMSCAGLSFALCNAPSKSGLFLATLEVVGRTEWHNQTVAMIERDRGFHFLQSTVNHKNMVLAKIYKLRSEHLEQELKALLKRSGDGTP